MKRRIYDDYGNEGFVYFDPSDKTLLVTYDDKDVKRMILNYLRSDVSLKVGTGLNLQDNNHIAVKPTDDRGYFDMALCQMYFTIGVHVDWDSEENTNGEGTITDSLIQGSKYRII